MKLSRVSKLGLGTGVSAAILMALLADLPFGPAGLMQIAYSAALPTPTPTGVPAATATPCINAATPTPIPTGVIPGPTGSPTGVPGSPTPTPCALPATATPTVSPAGSSGSSGSGTPSSNTTPGGVNNLTYTGGVDPSLLTPHRHERDQCQHQRQRRR